MSDFLIDMALSILLRVLSDQKSASKWRRALLKVFQRIAEVFRSDPEFRRVANSIGGPTV